ncbi:MAG: O-acetylhomoserine aminocarboxypropyltransferase/cysteine synthase family protein [Angelakisella sp.]|nr:O-acetylhomoserine aminocarboxypropyltransferase/cysteine synthase family protein [Angelakisella sp.]
MKEQNYGLDTLALHAGFRADQIEGSTEVPIHQTSAYMFQSTQHAQELFELKAAGNIYSRLGNPTVTVLEERVAALEGGVGAVAFASGHAAIFSTILCLCQTGDEVVSSLNIYGGAINMFGVTLGNLGIKVNFVTGNDAAGWEAKITPKTKVLFVEVVGNPNANVADLEAISAVAKKHGIPFIVDSTFTTPALIRPKEFGADIVIHSATKFMGGHGTSLAGIAVDCGTFRFEGNPKFPYYNEPDVSYHGVVFAKDFGAAGFATRLRALILRDLGGCLAPMNAWLILQGMETLGLRMERHCQNAVAVAQYLKNHPAISFVSCPALPESPYYSLAQKYLGGKGGAVFTFGLKGGRQAGGKFIDSLKLAANVANVGATKTQVIHPATTTHSQLSEEQLAASGISGETVRISVGIENVEDIIADLEQALAAASC